MTAVQRAKTWPLNEGRGRFDNERRILTPIPISMIDDLHRHDLRFRTLQDGRLIGVADIVPSLTVVWPFLADRQSVPVNEAQSLQVEPTLRDSGHETPVFFSRNSATPEGSVAGEFVYYTPDVLDNIGYVVPSEHGLSAIRRLLGDNISISSGQSGTSHPASSGNNPQSPHRSATPTRSIPADGSLTRRHVIDSLHHISEVFPSTPTTESTSRRSSSIATDIGGVTMQAPISRRHPDSTATNPRDQTRQAPSGSARPDTGPETPSQIQKRKMPPPSHIVEDRTSERDSASPQSKRRKMDHNGSDDESERSVDQE